MHTNGIVTEVPQLRFQLSELRGDDVIELEGIGFLFSCGLNKELSLIEQPWRVFCSG